MNGFVNLIKPAGLTASDLVIKVRKALNTKKVGHLGTLDPLATGVLPIAVGKGTKLFNLLLVKEKTYHAFFTFGVTTDTLDSEGIVTEKSNVIPNVDNVKLVCQKMVGIQQQLPPMYSAKSINGTRAYVLARKGETVELKTKEIEIFSLEYIRQYNHNTFEFEIVCSSGTYIRSIARDMAKMLGTCGFMSGLIRTKSGLFSIDDAITIDELFQQKELALQSIEIAIKDLPRFDFDSNYYRQLSNGVKLPFDKQNYHTIYCNNELFGVGKSQNNLLDLEFYLK